MSDEDIAEAIQDQLLVDNFDTDVEWFLSYHGSREAYAAFREEANADIIARYKRQADHAATRVKRLTESIKKENVKLAKAQAQA